MKTQISFKTIVVCAAMCAVTAMQPAAGRPGSATYHGIAAAGATSLRSSVTVEGNGLTRTLAISESPANSDAHVKTFDVDMQKRMHLIVVSDDLTQFMHIHPSLQPDGTFRITTTFPRPGFYHLYADAEPHGFGHSVFRFDVPIDATLQTRSTSLSPLAVANVGPYRVRLSTAYLKAGSDNPLLIAITKDGEPASDLHPYLGAYAHIVAIGVKDLSYTHIHAIDMSAMENGGPMEGGQGMAPSATVPATMDVHVNLQRPGLYKVWVQFRGGSQVYVAPLVVTAR
ncbi:MAG TPA: hypothetical protein VEV38_12680 [Candidatus Eremiobacteraceae bacterium]|nr:hypothetical protein [Candidatus Eremiobacteraceae bacterium]